MLRPLSQGDLDRALAVLAPDLAARDRPVLAALAEGAPGRALELADADGLALYREIVAVLTSLPRVRGETLFALAERVARAPTERGVGLFVPLLSGLLQRAVRGAHAATLEVPGETDLLARLRGLAPLEAWVSVWENLRATAIRAETLNLDKKQLVLNAFFEMEAVAGRGA
jgi:DNA polymerase-3 subunit delta'